MAGAKYKDEMLEIIQQSAAYCIGTSLFEQIESLITKIDTDE